MPDDCELDTILDSGLAGYTEAEPLAGLEERILQRVRSVRLKRKSGRALAAVCCLAAAIVAFVILLPVRVERPTPVRIKSPLSDVRWQATKGDGLHHLKKRARRAILARQPDFPARTPLSSVERVLLQMASSSNEVAKSAEPITIEPIEVSPITTNDSGAENDSYKP